MRSKREHNILYGQFKELNNHNTLLIYNYL